MKTKATSFGDGASVRITGKHPHSGKHGTIRGGLHTSSTFTSWRMWRIVLEDGSECFADEKKLVLSRD